jgi:hypothetical protein
MNFKTTVVLLILLIIVGGLAVYVRTSHKETPAVAVTEKNAGPGKALFDVKADDISSIDIKPANGEEIALKKNGNDWRLTRPVNAPAINFEVDQILTPILAMRSVSQVDPSQATGLNPAKYNITLTTHAGKTIGIAVGDRSAIGDAIYVRLQGSNMADVVSAQGSEINIKSVSDLRDKALVHVTSDKIEQVVLQDQDEPKIVLHKEGSKWQEVEPLKFNADPDVMSRVLSSITGLEAGSFLKSNPKPAISQLDQPQVRVSFSTKPPTTQPAAHPAAESGMTTIRLGQYDTIRKENIYASVSDSPEVVKVTASHLEDFKQKPLDFRDKDVLNIDPDKVKSFTVAINKPATTQPTTQPAEMREFTIERHKPEAPDLGPAPILGPALPDGLTPGHAPATQPAAHAATTQPAVAGEGSPTTRPAIASTQPSSPTTRLAVATTQPSAPTTRPAVATTQPSEPATTQRAVATTQPTTKPSDIAAAKWIFTSGGSGAAEEGQVTELLADLHPLRAEKYLDTAKERGATYTLTLHVIPATAADSAEDIVLTFVDAGGQVEGLYKDLHFTVSHSLIDKLNGDFKTKKVAPPEPPPSQFPGGRGGLPFGG